MINIFKTPKKTVKKFSKFLAKEINNSANNKEIFFIALSGGSTPQLLFKKLNKKYKDKIDWSYVHIFWGDERCVVAEDSESNYGVAKELLLNSIEIPIENIHHINGEEDPNIEAKRYSEEILNILPIKNGLPSFDLCLLGLGSDGHTASIFPDQMELLKSDKICKVAIHPETEQRRITITGDVINNSKNVSFLVTGEAKRKVVAEIINQENGYLNYPASHINPSHGKLSWYLDEAAGSLINSEMF